MFCPRCGKENPEGAQLCHSCSWVLKNIKTHAPIPVTKISGLAIAAFVLGILSIFTLALTTIPAIILGIISLVRIEKSGGKLTGKGFAIGGIVIPVVAVPLLIIALLMPALKRVRGQARAIACQSNLKQWGLMFAMYCDDNNGYFFSGEGSDNGRWWMDPLRPYHKGYEKLFLCPAATKPYTEGGRNPFGAWKVGDALGSYAPNGWICNPPKVKTELWGRGPTENYWRTPNVKGANNIPVFLESMWAEAWPRETDEPPPSEDWLKDKVNQNELKANQDKMRCFCINRHEGFVNTLFLDWSARRVGLKELWTLKWHRDYNTAGPWTKGGGVQPMDWPKWMRNFRDY